MLPIPEIPRHLHAARMRRAILRDPVPASWRGAPVTVSIAEPSLQRRQMEGGMMEEVSDLEVLIVIEPTDPAPDPGRDRDSLRFAVPGQQEARWRLRSARPHLGASGVWTLSVTRAP